MNINNFQQQNRYLRNLDLEGFSPAMQQELFNKKVLIAGAGGLGSGVIANITSLGVGTIGLIDSDTVESSNLNRQFVHKHTNIGKPKVHSAFEWIKSFSPNTQVNIYYETIQEDSRTDFFREYDLIIDCFDSYKSKFLLNKICVTKEIPMIHGGVEEFSGQVMTVIPSKSTCLNCLFDQPEVNTEVKKGIISPTASIIASIQAMEAAKFLLNQGGLLTDTLLAYNGKNQDFRKIELTKRKDCPICS